MLFVDSREKQQVRKVIDAVAGPTHVRALESADFLLFDKDAHSLGIERKTVSDLLSSLTTKQGNSNHLFDSLDRMAATYTHRLLLIEGDWRYADKYVGTPRRMSGWLASAVGLILWGIQADGTYVWPTASLEHTAEILRVLHQRANNGCVLPKALRTPIERAA